MFQSTSPSQPIRPCTVVWLLLMGLTLFTLVIGELEISSTTIVSIILVTTLLKSQLIVDYFMGLHRVRWLWKIIMLVWLILVIGLIGMAYWLGYDVGS